jgi:hypothetical protein
MSYTGLEDGSIPMLHIVSVIAIVTKGDDSIAPILVFSAAIPAVDDKRRRLHIDQGVDHVLD